MSTLIKFRALFGSLVVALFLSAPASAFTVWAVEGGAAANSNSAGNVLQVGSGVNQIDLYFSTEGDISWGWDITLSIAGTGSISNVLGGDINGGLGTALLNGYQQTGGNPAVDLNTSSDLMFSFTYDSDAGTILSLTADSIYTSGNTFSSEMITNSPLVETVAAVPVPSAGWLFLSALAGLSTVRKR